MNLQPTLPCRHQPSFLEMINNPISSENTMVLLPLFTLSWSRTVDVNNLTVFASLFLFQTRQQYHRLKKHYKLG